MKPSPTLLRACGKGSQQACDIAKRIQAMYAGSMVSFSNVKANDENPNKMPYSGTLLLVDTASTKPPHGSQGHRIYVPMDVAKDKLAGIIGMAINYDPGGLDEHATRHKVGVITKAWIEGKKVKVSGFVYKKDFPEAVRDLKGRDDLGMSMELADVYVRDEDEPVWHLEDFEFTGATILKKEAAAYHQTSLAAQVAAAASGTRKGEAMKKSKDKEKVAAAHRDTGQSNGSMALMAQAIGGQLSTALTNALQPIVAEMKASNERLLEEMEEVKGLHLINAAAQRDADEAEEEDEIVLNAAKDDDDDDDDDDMAAKKEDDDDDDDMEAAKGDDDTSSDGDESSASSDGSELNAMEDLELEDASEEPGEVNKDASNKGNKTSVTKPPKQGEHFAGNVAKGRIHSKAAKGAGKVKKLFPGVKAGSSLHAAAVQIGELQASYKRVRREMKAQAEAFITKEKKWSRKFDRVNAQVERFAELEGRRSAAPVELVSLLSKNGYEIGEVKASGQKFSVAGFDAMFQKAATQGIILEPQDRIALKMLAEEQGILDAGEMNQRRLN